ncbi:hypothetical protein SAY86_010062 [Trapa natans]|uniref:Uncharacterized protein n=1 Tax=Trapa natans TaxID=22666 RepID=A0AAN7QQS5_TRANT|nr:hypothetical protein SAY86_010062 [Trapa natans]
MCKYHQKLHPRKIKQMKRPVQESNGSGLTLNVRNIKLVTLILVLSKMLTMGYMTRHNQINQPFHVTCRYCSRDIIHLFLYCSELVTPVQGMLAHFKDQQIFFILSKWIL